MHELGVLSKLPPWAADLIVWPQFMIEAPYWAIMPSAVFFLLYLWTKRHLCFAAGIAWLLYLVVEYGNHFQLFCSASCSERFNFAVLYPILDFISLIALIEAGWWIYKNRETAF